MADYHAISAVSKTLRDLLQDRMEGGTEGPVRVMLQPPDKAKGAGKCLNLYLFHVSPNACLSNQDLHVPVGGGRAGHSHLSLDLRYLMTAFASDADESADSDVDAQTLLGDGMRTLHDFSIVTKRLARQKIAVVGDPLLDKSILFDVEHLRVTLEDYSLDDLNKLWSAFPDVNFRRSVVYHVSVLQIASQIPRRVPRPVGEPPLQGPRVAVTTLRTPRIDEVRVLRSGATKESHYPLARCGDRLILLGSQLFDDEIREVRLGNTVLKDADIHEHQSNRVVLTIPDKVDPAVGPVTVCVRIGPKINKSDEPAGEFNKRPLFASNSAVFMLAPRIIGATHAGFHGSNAIVKVTGTSLFAKGGECALILGAADTTNDVVAVQYNDAASPSEVQFTLPKAVGAGTYPIRVRVNGAESIDNKTITVPASP